MAESKKTTLPTQPVPDEAKTEASKNDKPAVQVNYSPNAADQVIYADGIQGVSVIAGVGRIELYQILVPGTDKRPEQRVITHRLAIPLTGLGELARMLNSVGEALKRASEKQDKKG